MSRGDAVKVRRVAAPDGELLEIDGGVWEAQEARRIELVPAPVVLAADASAQMALSRSHGKVSALWARMAHNGETLSIRLAWEDPQKDDRILDLDRFVDAAAVMFPLGDDANPVTMGDEKRPVNAWLWKADRSDPFDVIARGYSTSQRRPGKTSGLRVRARHRAGEWGVVFQRSLEPQPGEYTRFAPGGTAKIAYAVWEGSNGERAGQKAVSGAFLDLTLDWS